MAEIQKYIREIKQTQDTIFSKLSTSSQSSSVVQAVLPQNIKLPINEVQKLQNLELWLEKDLNATILTNYLSCIGGNKTSSITRRILGRVFTNAFASKCNWSGKNNKHSLKNLRLIKVILDAVRKNKASHTETDATIINILTSWFRFAKDRSGGRESRRAPAKQ